MLGSIEKEVMKLGLSGILRLPHEKFSIYLAFNHATNYKAIISYRHKKRIKIICKRLKQIDFMIVFISLLLLVLKRSNKNSPVVG
jgi:hypothetical protein